jgi:hypothetical protein
MAQGSTLAFYDADVYPSFAEAQKSDNGLVTVCLDYAHADTMSQTAVWDALEIINATLTVAGRRDANLRFVLMRDGKILDC